MDFAHYDLGTLKRGQVVEVSLDKRANVLLLDHVNFNNYRSGRRHTYYGGQAVKSPLRIPVPRHGHWHVVVDLGGNPGSVRSSVQVLSVALPQIRTHTTSLDSIAAAALDIDDRPPDERRFDVFISHAAEDKNDVVRPLARALQAEGIDVWFDEFELSAGDDLQRKIDYGLENSRFGVVVLSRAFLAKPWTRYELDRLVTREMAGDDQVLLPIWHNVSKADILRESPSLAGKLALKTADATITEIAEEIASVVQAV